MTRLVPLLLVLLALFLVCRTANAQAVTCGSLSLGPVVTHPDYPDGLAILVTDRTAADLGTSDQC
jgi:hypothetical protein